MNQRKFFNSENGGCIIFYIVVFITMPSLFFNFLQCSNVKNEGNNRDTIAMQRDSIRYLEGLCKIDTAMANDIRWDLTGSIADIGATASKIKLHVFELEAEEGESDITVELQALSSFLMDKSRDALLMVDTLNLTLKNDSASFAAFRKTVNTHDR